MRSIAAAVVVSVFLVKKILALRYFKAIDGSRKVVLITGAASGLGLSTTNELIKRGDFVIGCDLNESAVTELEKKYPNNFMGLIVNVADANSVKNAVETFKEKNKKNDGAQLIDGIINFAGIQRGGPLTEMDDSALKLSLDVNIMGTHHVNKYFFPFLNRENTKFQARILNICSEVSYAQIAAAFNAPYSMTKLAMENYSNSLRQEFLLLKPQPVKVIVVNPGAHATDMTAHATKDFDSKLYANSKFESALSAGSKAAADYINRNKVPAQHLALTLADVIHQVNPDNRVLANVSIEMHLAKYTPQWVMDKGNVENKTKISLTHTHKQKSVCSHGWRSRKVKQYIYIYILFLYYFVIIVVAHFIGGFFFR